MSAEVKDEHSQLGSGVLVIFMYALTDTPEDTIVVLAVALLSYAICASSLSVKAIATAEDAESTTSWASSLSIVASATSC